MHPFLLAFLNWLCYYIFVNNQKKKVVVDVYTKQTRLKDTLNTAKIKVMGASFLAGNPEDQNNTFEIKK